MANSQIELLAERVERLLVRHEELQRTNALAGTSRWNCSLTGA
jgi:hypothetical protein